MLGQPSLACRLETQVSRFQFRNTERTAIHCTRSRFSLSLLWYGSQTQKQLLQHRFNQGEKRLFSHLGRKVGQVTIDDLNSTVADVLAMVSLVCGRHESLSSNKTPRQAT